jgi:hypothetical protein
VAHTGAMIARELEQAAADVRGRRRQIAYGALAAVAISCSSIVAAPFSPRLGIALGAGAVGQAVLAIVTWLRRRELIERLALEPAAYAIPEVARFGSRVATPSERRRLAAWIQSLLHEPEQPLHMHLAGRAMACAHELEAIARELVAPSSRVPPAIAVACRRLLTRPVQSPLYNPNLPEEDLIAVLRRILAGIVKAEKAPLRADPR